MRDCSLRIPDAAVVIGPEISRFLSTRTGGGHGAAGCRYDSLVETTRSAAAVGHAFQSRESGELDLLVRNPWAARKATGTARGFRSRWSETKRSPQPPESGERPVGVVADRGLQDVAPRSR